MSEPITFARAGGPPDNWCFLDVFDGEVALELVREVDTARGYALVHYRDDAGQLVLAGDEPALRRIESPNLSIRVRA